MSTIWIPQILVYYKLDHQTSVWLPFVLPGIITLLLIFIFKKAKQNKTAIKRCIYHIFFCDYISILCICKLNLLIITLLFSNITGICQLTQITIRRMYIQNNVNIANNILLQSLNVNNYMFLIFISFLKYARVDVGIAVLIVNIFCVIYLIFKTKKE